MDSNQAFQYFINFLAECFDHIMTEDFFTCEDISNKIIEVECFKKLDTKKKSDPKKLLIDLGIKNSKTIKHNYDLIINSEVVHRRPKFFNNIHFYKCYLLTFENKFLGYKYNVFSYIYNKEHVMDFSKYSHKALRISFDSFWNSNRDKRLFFQGDFAHLLTEKALPSYTDIIIQIIFSSTNYLAFDIRFILDNSKITFYITNDKLNTIQESLTNFKKLLTCKKISANKLEITTKTNYIINIEIYPFIFEHQIQINSPSNKNYSFSLDDISVLTDIRENIFRYKKGSDNVITLVFKYLSLHAFKQQNPMITIIGNIDLGLLVPCNSLRKQEKKTTPSRKNEETCTICLTDFEEDETLCFNLGCCSDKIHFDCAQSLLSEKFNSGSYYLRCPNCNTQYNGKKPDRNVEKNKLQKRQMDFV